MRSASSTEVRSVSGGRTGPPLLRAIPSGLDAPLGATVSGTTLTTGSQPFAMDSGALALHAGADVAHTTAALCALPGIGDWTAQYIAMRVLRWPDAFPAGDVALHKALGVQGHKNPARAAAEASQAWRPWRSYAVLRAWAGGPAVAAAAEAPAPPLQPDH